MASIEHLANDRTKRGVGFHAWVWRTTDPGIIALAGDLHELTERLDMMVGLLRVDERKPHVFSLTEKAANFFKISWSSSSEATRFLSAVFSALSRASSCSGVSFSP